MDASVVSALIRLFIVDSVLGFHEIFIQSFCLVLKFVELFDVDVWSVGVV